MQCISVMYHYIESEQKYGKGIYPTSVERLESQIQNIKKKYTFISGQDLALGIQGEKKLPEYSCLLTFDDGLKTQYTNALPLLEKYEISAMFFVPTKHLTDQIGYTIHKVHTLLSLLSPEKLLYLLEEKYTKLVGSSINWSVLDMDFVLSWYRYDDVASAKFKFMINHYLTTELAETLINTLFQEIFEGTEEEFCKKLYMSKEDLQYIHAHPLCNIGLHTHSHIDIPALSESAVCNDIKKNYNYLNQEIGVTNIQGISYPFGLITQEIFHEKLQNVFHSLHLSFGLSTDKKINKNFDEYMILGRFGGNDIFGGKRPVFEI